MMIAVTINVAGVGIHPAVLAQGTLIRVKHNTEAIPAADNKQLY